MEAIGRRYSAVYSHDFEREMLVVEVDLTGLRASKRAEGSTSTKGYFSGERNATGRQLLRVIAPQYKEVLFEKLYPGNTTSCEVLKESLKETERFVELDAAKRRRTLVRLDGVLAPMLTSTGCVGAATSSSPKATGESEPTSWPRACPKTDGEKDPPKASFLAFQPPLIVTPARPRVC